MHWIKENYSEGGYIFIGDTTSFLNWRGGDDLDRQWTIHFYGPMVKSLPAAFIQSKKRNWHQYKNINNLSEAQTFICNLLAFIKQNNVNRDVDLSSNNDKVDIKRIKEKGNFNCIVKIDGVIELSIFLSSSSHYTLLCQNTDKIVKKYRFGKQEALFFQMELDGDLHIGFNDDASEICIFSFTINTSDTISMLQKKAEKLPIATSHNFTFRDQALYILCATSTPQAVIESMEIENLDVIKEKLTAQPFVYLHTSYLGGYALFIKPGSYEYSSYFQENNEGLKDEGYCMIGMKLKKYKRFKSKSNVSSPAVG